MIWGWDLVKKWLNAENWLNRLIVDWLNSLLVLFTFAFLLVDISPCINFDHLNNILFK